MPANNQRTMRSHRDRLLPHGEIQRRAPAYSQPLLKRVHVEVQMSHTTQLLVPQRRKAQSGKLRLMWRARALTQKFSWGVFYTNTRMTNPQQMQQSSVIRKRFCINFCLNVRRAIKMRTQAASVSSRTCYVEGKSKSLPTSTKHRESTGLLRKVLDSLPPQPLAENARAATRRGRLWENYSCTSLSGFSHARNSEFGDCRYSATACRPSHFSRMQRITDAVAPHRLSI
eukprot:TRINITY_DN106096_c0_g1_i1.p1 TRINITY_DN106096_c0_g1~~TRINITY_DN106096_c0_g1_i1.p1  ORF type:complete len:228 (+),score=12.93 TRINITY_DN106096_c0_g1_i1:319-1002(+)